MKNSKCWMSRCGESALLLAFAVCASITPGAAAESTVGQKALLEIAEDVGRWLEAQANDEERGISWPDDALNAEVSGYDLGAGTAGKVLYFTALYRATGNERYLERAEQGADYLVELLGNPAVFDENRRRASLYSGIAGIGVALINLQQSSRAERYAEAIVRIVDLLDQWSIQDQSGLHWSNEFNDLIFGEAGTVLFLAFAAEQTANPRALEMATQGGRFLLAEAQPAAHGSYWYFRRGRDFNLPNFSHGTAGIGYVLATLATLTGDQAYRAAAADGFTYLESIAETDGEMFRLPYGWGSESWDGLYEFGWAHGLSGTALFLERLRQAGIRAEPAVTMSRAIRDALISINLPGTPAPPFGEPATPLDQRFGRAGVLGLLDEWGRTDERVRATRDALRTHIEQAGIRAGNALHWEVEAPDFMGGGTAAYTGYFHGAAGIGLAMLGLQANLSGHEPYVMLPDNPFSWSPKPVDDER